MRYSFDTNIFIRSLINIDYRKCSDQFFNSKTSFLPRSLLKELNLLTHISSYVSKVKQLMDDNRLTILEAIDHIRLNSYKRKYFNIYSYLKYCFHKNIKIHDIESSMIRKVNIILSSIHWQSSVKNRRFIYPKDEDSFVKIIADEGIQNKRSKVSLEDEDDAIHCLLCEAFGMFEEKDIVYFISDDGHVTDPGNKKKIESIMEYLKVDTFKDFLSYADKFN